MRGGGVVASHLGEGVRFGGVRCGGWHGEGGRRGGGSHLGEERGEMGVNLSWGGRSEERGKMQYQENVPFDARVLHPVPSGMAQFQNKGNTNTFNTCIAELERAGMGQTKMEANTHMRSKTCRVPQHCKATMPWCGTGCPGHLLLS